MKKIALSWLMGAFLLMIAGSALAQNTQRDQMIQDINQSIKAVKLWDYEGMTLDNTGSFKYHICLTPDCNPFVSWDFYVKLIKNIELGKFEEYDVITFTCMDANCIIPTGYQPGGRYDMKSALQLFIKDPKQGAELVKKLKELQKIDFSK